jgi:outer membrane lipoprotein SlyB
MIDHIAYGNSELPMKFLATTLVLISATLLSGCPSNLTGDSYSREDARNVQTVVYGTIISTRPVQIEGTKTAVGPAAGAIVGGLAGSTVGGGSGSNIAAAVGAIGGGLLGGATEEAVTKTQGIEITVRLDSKETQAIVQAVSPNDHFMVGQRVRLLSVNGQTRVSP